MIYYSISNIRSKPKIILYLSVILFFGHLGIITVVYCISILHTFNDKSLTFINIFIFLLSIICIRHFVTYIIKLVSGPFGKVAFNLQENEVEITSINLIGIKRSNTFQYTEIIGIELLPKNGKIELRTNNKLVYFGDDLERISALDVLSELLKRIKIC